MLNNANLLQSPIIPQRHIEKNATKLNSNTNIATSKSATKNNKLKLALTALGVLGAATAVGIAIYRHKNPVVSLKDISFGEGIAFLKKTGEKYTGQIKHTYPNGDKLIVQYSGGVIQKSTRTGQKSFEKIYQTNANNELIIKITKNGTTETKNLTQLNEKIKKELLEKQNANKAQIEGDITVPILEDLSVSASDLPKIDIENSAPVTHANKPKTKKTQLIQDEEMVTTITKDGGSVSKFLNPKTEIEYINGQPRKLKLIEKIYHPNGNNTLIYIEEETGNKIVVSGISAHNYTEKEYVKKGKKFKLVKRRIIMNALCGGRKEIIHQDGGLTRIEQFIPGEKKGSYKEHTYFRDKKGRFVDLYAETRENARIKRAQEIQDTLIEAMLHPSNKSAEESANRILAIDEIAKQQALDAKIQKAQKGNDAVIFSMQHPSATLKNPNGKSAFDSAQTLFFQDTKHTKRTPKFDENKKLVQINTQINRGSKEGGIDIEEIFENGSVRNRTMVTKSATTFTYDTPEVKRINTEGRDGSYNFKIYEKADGKLKPIGRRSYDANTRTYKDVTQLSGGISRTVTVNENNNVATVVYRDKKGNIVKDMFKENTEAPYRPWYFPEPDKSEPEHEVLIQSLFNTYQNCKETRKLSEIPSMDMISSANRDMLNQWDYYIQFQPRLWEYKPYKPVLAHLIDLFGSTNVLERIGFTKEETKLLLKANYYDLENMIKSIKNGAYTAHDVMMAFNKAIDEQGNQSNIQSALKKAIDNIETRITNKISENENTIQYFTQVSDHTVQI